MTYDLLVRIFVKTDEAGKAEEIAKEAIASIHAQSVPIVVAANQPYWKLPELREVALILHSDEPSLFVRVRDAIGDGWEEKNDAYDRWAVLATRAGGRPQTEAIDWVELSWVPRTA